MNSTTIPVGFDRIGNEAEVGKEWGYKIVVPDGVKLEESNLEYYWRLYDDRGSIVRFEKGEKFLTSVDEPGDYRLKLTICDTSNDRIDNRSPISISISKRNQSPIAGLSIGQLEVPVHQPIEFDASSSRDPDGRIKEYKWSVYQLTDSDGNPVEGQAGKKVLERTTTVKTITPSFANAGQYWMMVEVFDNKGEMDRAKGAFIVINK